MKKGISVKLLSLTLLSAVLFTGCGKKGEDALIAAESNGLGANSESTTSEGELTDSPTDVVNDPENPDAPVEPEDPVDSENETLLLNTNLVSDCFFSKTATEEFGRETYLKSQYKFHDKGKGHYSFWAYSDNSCEELFEKDQFQISYELVKTIDKVWVISIKQARGYSGKKELFFWITLLPKKDHIFLDIDGMRTNSGPYFQEPSEEVVSEFSLEAETIGIGFFRK